MRHNGSPPFGFKRVNGETVPDDQEQKVLAEIRALQGRGYSLADIADVFNGLNQRGPRGGTWTRQYISRLLKANPQAET